MFARPIVIGQRFRWTYTGANEFSKEAEVVNVFTDSQEGLSPESWDYAALWVDAKYVQDSPTAQPFTILLSVDKLTYLDGKEVTIEVLS